MMSAEQLRSLQRTEQEITNRKAAHKQFHTVPLCNASLVTLHAYAQVHNSIYVYIYIYICSCSCIHSIVCKYIYIYIYKYIYVYMRALGCERHVYYGLYTHHACICTHQVLIFTMRFAVSITKCLYLRCF